MRRIDVGKIQPVQQKMFFNWKYIFKIMTDYSLFAGRIYTEIC